MQCQREVVWFSDNFLPINSTFDTNFLGTKNILNFELQWDLIPDVQKPDSILQDFSGSGCFQWTEGLVTKPDH